MRSRLSLTVSQVFERFKTGQDSLTFDTFVKLIVFFMGFELLDDEEKALLSYLDNFCRTT